LWLTYYNQNILEKAPEKHFYTEHSSQGWLGAAFSTYLSA